MRHGWLGSGAASFVRSGLAATIASYSARAAALPAASRVRQEVRRSLHVFCFCGSAHPAVAERWRGGGTVV